MAAAMDETLRKLENAHTIADLQGAHADIDPHTIASTAKALLHDPKDIRRGIILLEAFAPIIDDTFAGLIATTKGIALDSESIGERLYAIGLLTVLAERTLDHVDTLLLISSQTSAPLPVALAVVTAVGHLARRCPVLLTKLIPVLVDLYETPQENPVHKRMLQHALGMQLSSLMAVAEAEKFYPLLVEALGKTQKRQREESAADDVDDEPLPERKRPSAAFATEQEPLDALQVPLPAAIEIVLHTIRTLDTRRLKAAIDVWRPSRVQRPAARRDPRQAAALVLDVPEVQTKRAPVQPFQLHIVPVPDRLAMAGKLFRRVLEAGESTARFGWRSAWEMLVCRLPRAVPGLARVLLDFCFGGGSEHADLVLLWLRVLFFSGTDYAAGVGEVLERASQCEDEVLVVRVLAEAPDLPAEPVAALIARLHGRNAALALKVLERLVWKRPVLRDRLVSQLCEYVCVEDAVARRLAVLTAENVYAVATGPLLACADTLVGAAMAHEPAEDGDHMQYAVYFDLALGLAKRNGAAVKRICECYSRLLDPCREHLRARSSAVGETIDQAGLLRVLDSTATAAEWTVQVMEGMSAIDEPLLEAVVRAVGQGRLDGRFLVPAMPQLDVESAYAFLPRLLAIDDAKAVSLGLYRLVEKTGSASEVFMRLHSIGGSSAVPLKACMEATQLCFSMPHVFTPDALLTALTHMLDVSPVPTLFMRSVIQSVTLYRHLAGAIANLLTRLIAKRVWEMGKATWEGFVRCCKVMGAGAMGVLTQMPPSPLREVLAKAPELRVLLREHVYGQPPSLRTRLAAVVQVVEEGDGRAV